MRIDGHNQGVRGNWDRTWRVNNYLRLCVGLFFRHFLVLLIIKFLLSFPESMILTSFLFSVALYFWGDFLKTELRKSIKKTCCSCKSTTTWRHLRIHKRMGVCVRIWPFAFTYCTTKNIVLCYQPKRFFKNSISICFLY